MDTGISQAIRFGGEASGGTGEKQRTWSWRAIAIAGALTLATVLKIYCAATTFGTNDTGLFHLYGQVLFDGGLQQTYASSPYFNHTPTLADVLMFLYWLSGRFSLPFPLLLRLPGILADILTTVALWRFVERKRPGELSTWWICLFALNPVSFMVSGYHGNFDSVLAMFVFLAACEAERGRLELCALYFALAVHVKIAPLILSPIFFFYWVHRGEGLRFFVVTMALLLAVWLVPLLEFPRLFIHNVFEYGSYWGIWGITFWLTVLPDMHMKVVSFYDLFPIQRHIMTGLKAVVCGTILFTAWRRRAASIFETLSCGWAIFFVFAPGVLLHYLAWPACTMLLHARRWWLAILCTSTIFLFWCYTVINDGLPWDKGLFGLGVLNYWRGWSNIPWLAYVGFLGFFAMSAMRKGRADRAMPETQAQVPKGV